MIALDSFLWLYLVDRERSDIGSIDILCIETADLETMLGIHAVIAPPGGFLGAGLPIPSDEDFWGLFFTKTKTKKLLRSKNFFSL